MFSLCETPSDKRCVMQQFLTYLCIDVNETGPSLVIFLGVDRFYVVRFFFVGYISMQDIVQGLWAFSVPEHDLPG